MDATAVANDLVSNVDSDTITVSSGDAAAGCSIVAWYGFNSGSTINTVSDSGGSYTSATEGRIVDSGNSQAGHVYYRDNVSAGTYTVTATWTGGTPIDRRLRLIKVFGLDSAAFDRSAGQFQAAPGTGTDACSSGATAATTNANDFILGLTQDSSEPDPGTGTINAGTGFTIVGTVTRVMAVESRSVSATGSYAATFTLPANTSQISHVIIFKEGSGGGGGGNNALAWITA